MRSQAAIAGKPTSEGSTGGHFVFVSPLQFAEQAGWGWECVGCQGGCMNMPCGRGFAAMVFTMR